MDAETEGEMAVRLAGDVEPVGIRELRRVAVGGADAQMHPGLRRQGDAGDLDFAGGDPVAELVGAFEAQEFLDRAVDQRRLCQQLRPRLRPGAACLGSDPTR